MSILSQYEVIYDTHRGHFGWNSKRPVIPVSYQRQDLCNETYESIFVDTNGMSRYIDFGETFYAELLIEGFEQNGGAGSIRFKDRNRPFTYLMSTPVGLSSINAALTRRDGYVKGIFRHVKRGGSYRIEPVD